VHKYNNNITSGIFIGTIKQVNFELDFEALQQILNFINHLFIGSTIVSRDILYFVCGMCIRTYAHTHARTHIKNKKYLLKSLIQYISFHSKYRYEQIKEINKK